MIDSKQLLHELARLKARQVAAGLQFSQASLSQASQALQGPQGSQTSSGALGSREARRAHPGDPSARAIERTADAPPLELHLVTDFSGRVVECDAELAVLLTGEAELRGAGLDDFVAISGQPEFGALLERVRATSETDTFGWRGALRTARSGEVRVVASVIAHPGGAGTLSWLLRVHETNGAGAPKHSIPDLAFVAATDPMMLGVSHDR